MPTITHQNEQQELSPPRFYWLDSKYSVPFLVSPSFRIPGRRGRDFFISARGVGSYQVTAPAAPLGHMIHM